MELMKELNYNTNMMVYIKSHIDDIDSSMRDNIAMTEEVQHDL